jgi:hypothetical protein
VNKPHLEPVAEVWRALADAPDAFKIPETTLVRINPDSHICPSDWTGFVRLGDSAVITAPNESVAGVIEAAMPATAESLLSVLLANQASLRAASALGFEEFGLQISVQLA